MAAFVRKFVDKEPEEAQATGGLPVPNSDIQTGFNVLLTIDSQTDDFIPEDNDVSFVFTTVNP